MHVLLVHGAQHAVPVHADAELLQQVVDVGAQAGLAALGQQQQQRPAAQDELLHGLRGGAQEQIFYREQQIFYRERPGASLLWGALEMSRELWEP